MCGCSALLCVAGSLAGNTTVVQAPSIPDITVTAPRINPGQTLFTYLPNGAAGTPIIYSEQSFPSITFNISSPFLGNLSADRDQDGKVDCVEGLVAGNATVSSSLGMRTLNGVTSFHNGTDLAAPTGRLIFSAKPGVVSQIIAGHGPGQGPATGNLVRVNHNDGTQGVYLHLLAPASGLSVGQQVRAGEIIATSNDSGASTGPHLHYSEWKHQNGGNVQNPANFNDPESEYGTGGC